MKKKEKDQLHSLKREELEKELRDATKKIEELHLGKGKGEVRNSRAKRTLRLKAAYILTLQKEMEHI